MSLDKNRIRWYLAATITATGMVPVAIGSSGTAQAQSPSHPTPASTPKDKKTTAEASVGSGSAEVTAAPINYSLDPLTGIYTRAGLVRILEDDASKQTPPISSPSDVDEGAIAPGQLTSAQDGTDLNGPVRQGQGLSQQFRTPTPLMDQSSGGTLRLTPITVPDTNVDKIGTGIRPEDVTKDRMPVKMGLPDGYAHNQGLMHEPKAWVPGGFWRQPLYWEDPMLERHGHQRFPAAQPLVSGARFYGTFLALPYLTTLKGPLEEVHTLGAYRPGSPAPSLRYRAHYDPKALRNEVLVGGAATAIAAP